MTDEEKDGWAPVEGKDGWAPEESPAARSAAPLDENASLQELLERRSAAGGQPSEVPTLPPALARMTGRELKENFQAIGQGAVTVFGAWIVYTLVGSAASFLINDLVLHHRTGLTGRDLWTAQALLAAPYVLLAFLGGLVVRRRTHLPRPQTWIFALAAVYAFIRFVRFRWCGEASAIGDALAARAADAAIVFAATRLGYAASTRRPGTEADRFGPGPIEP
jgi:hypothetical protein